MTYKIIFAGTPAFAAQSLQALLGSEHSVQAVYTQPDRPKGRGQQPASSAVKQLANAHHIAICQPQSFRGADEIAQLQSFKADLMVVVAYGLILPQAVLQAFPLGCINVHASLLPKYRGAAPIQRALLANEEKTGVTIMQMEAGLDTGPMLYQKECAIYEDDTSQALHDRLAILGAESLLAALQTLPTLNPVRQDEKLASYAQKITKEEARIHWQRAAYEISLAIRAFNPWPITFTQIDDLQVRIYSATVLKNERTHSPGQILKADKEGLDVATGDGVLRILTMQLPGGRVLPVGEILHAKRELFRIGKFFL